MLWLFPFPAVQAWYGTIDPVVITGGKVALTMLAKKHVADYTIRQWKVSLNEKEALQQMAIRQEQIWNIEKPGNLPISCSHCFINLSSLIIEDTRRADTYLNELSKRVPLPAA